MRRSHKMVSSLDSMDNEIFNTPLLPKDGNEVLIRTGAIGEGSCFFHAILTAYSSIYRKWNKREKYDYETQDDYDGRRFRYYRICPERAPYPLQWALSR